MSFNPTRRALLAAGLLLPAAPALAQTTTLRPRVTAPPPIAPADQALVDQAVAYLQALASARGRFTQVDPRGVTTQGTLYLQRPGKARFAYDPPSNILVVSNGSTVSVLNPRLRSFQSYPLGATPLSLFLARQIRLDRGVIVERVLRLEDRFEIVARDARRQAEGRITLSFSYAPALIGWTIVDRQNAATTVRISQLAPASGLEASLFVLNNPYQRRTGPRG